MSNCFSVLLSSYRIIYLQDYLTTMRAMPAPDDMQNIMLTSATEMDGYTNLVFHRKRKTGDTEKDVEIKVLNEIIQFTLPENGPISLKHRNRNHTELLWHIMDSRKALSSREMGGRLLLPEVINYFSSSLLIIRLVKICL